MCQSYDKRVRERKRYQWNQANSQSMPQLLPLNNITGPLDTGDYFPFYYRARISPPSQYLGPVWAARPALRALSQIFRVRLHFEFSRGMMARLNNSWPIFPVSNQINWTASRHLKIAKCSRSAGNIQGDRVCIPITSSGVSDPKIFAISGTVRLDGGIIIPRPSGFSMMIGSVIAISSLYSHSSVMSDPIILLNSFLLKLLLSNRLDHLCGSEEFAPECRFT